MKGKENETNINEWIYVCGQGDKPNVIVVPFQNLIYENRITSILVR